MQCVFRKHVWISGVALLGIATTNAWAGLSSATFPAGLNNVDRYGNPLTTGTITTFDALLNTCTGELIGTAQAKVRNDSQHLQIYLDNPRAAFIVYVKIFSSLYTVSDQGDAFLLATGRAVRH